MEKKNDIATKPLGGKRKPVFQRILKPLALLFLLSVQVFQGQVLDVLPAAPRPHHETSRAGGNDPGKENVSGGGVFQQEAEQSKHVGHDKSLSLLGHLFIVFNVLLFIGTVIELFGIWVSCRMFFRLREMERRYDQPRLTWRDLEVLRLDFNAKNPESKGTAPDEREG